MTTRLPTRPAIGLIRRTPEAETEWAAMYHDFPDHPGLVGAITGRSEAQTLRLSVIYAALDGGTAIDVPHLRAAKAVWDY